MSIPPIDNTQKFPSQQASFLEGKTPMFFDPTRATDQQRSRQAGEELGKISADSSAIKFDISPSRINEKIRDDLKASTLGDLLYNAPATLFNNLLMLEFANKPNSKPESKEEAIVSMLATLVLLSLGTEPSLLEDIKVKTTGAEQDTSLKDYYTTYPVKQEDNLMQVSPATNKAGGNSAEAQVLFTTDPSGAVTELSGTYKGPKSPVPKNIPIITLSEPINLQQIGKSILLSSKA
ncbi:MAG: hypothetical protein KGO93_00075 [Cyanobacteria bacterium REEB446]|nr:hypothetical protein [Cyanobacteria bacterium REEB446]